jgi:hypothetical protein
MTPASSTVSQMEVNLVTHDAALKAAIDALSDRWPWTLSWHELVSSARAPGSRWQSKLGPTSRHASTAFSSA